MSLVSEEEYLDIINFLGKYSYSQINSSVPFITKMFDSNPDYTIGYDEMRRLLDFYDKKKKEDDRLESVEDNFLDLIEGNSNIKVVLKRATNEMSVTIKTNSLSGLSSSLLEIDRRFKRSNIDFRILNFMSFIEKEMFSVKIDFEINVKS